MDVPAESSEHLPDHRAIEFQEFAVGEIEKRGLIFHAVGHNWTGAAIGMADAPRAPDTERVPAKYREYLAEADGARKLYGSDPQDTELCYSNAQARERFVGAVREYAANHEESMSCTSGYRTAITISVSVRIAAARYYVELLNAIDEALSAAGLDHRIAFLAHTDLLWPSVEARIENEDRFVLMFAPIRREYIAGYDDIEPAGIPPYERNDLEFPVDVSENVAFISAWFDRFDGDSFVFDYHFWRAYKRTPDATEFARFVGNDMRALREIGLEGSVSCNVRRAFFPAGIGVALAGAVLWDRTTSTEAFVDDYLEASCGGDYRAAGDVFDRLSKLLDDEYIRGRLSFEQPDVAEDCRELAHTIRSFRPIILRNVSRCEGTRAISWSHLEFHAELWEELAEALAMRARGEAAIARTRWKACRETAMDRGGEFVGAFDAWQFAATFDSLFEVDEPSSYRVGCNCLPRQPHDGVRSIVE